jgi:hypothetical protein
MVFFDKNLLDYLKKDLHSRQRPTFFPIETTGDLLRVFYQAFSNLQDD